MKTSELIAALAVIDGQPVRRAAPSRLLLPAAAIGAILALAALALTLGFQPLGRAVHASWFWMKFGYSLAFALAGFLLLRRLARPGVMVGAAGLVVGAASLSAMCVMAAHASMRTGADQQLALWLGGTWKVCSLRIFALAVPAFAALIVGLRRLAPTRLRWTGAASGLLAGGVSATIYGLYCQESTAPFVIVWYSLGIAACTLVGALLGPRLLRW
jgi:hypothetical protein